VWKVERPLVKLSWGGRRGLNPRHSVPQTDALPAELLPPPFDLSSLRYFLAMEKRHEKASRERGYRGHLGSKQAKSCRCFP
jgi:hypothetical protein